MHAAAAVSRNENCSAVTATDIRLLYLLARRAKTDNGKAACAGIDNIGIMPAELYSAINVTQSYIYYPIFSCF